MTHSKNQRGHLDCCWRYRAATSATAQSNFSNPNMTPVNDLPNPYSERKGMPLPDGREWGSTAGVDAGKGRDDIWAIDRCGSNTCVGSHVDPLLHYDGNGNLIGQMGAICSPSRTASTWTRTATSG